MDFADKITQLTEKVFMHSERLIETVRYYIE